MSQGARTRVAIGSACQIRSQTPRTIQQAFGPYARLETESARADRLDRIIGRLCGAVALAAIAALIVNAL